MTGGGQGADPRLDQILELLLAFASGDLSARVVPSGRNDDHDAIIAGLNMLGEELAAATKERQALEERLQANLRLQAVGQLASGLAHEMNNILAVIMGFASVLHTELPQGSAWFVDLTNILNATRRGRDLVQNMLGFAREGVDRAQSFSINGTVTEIQGMLGHTIPKRITLKTALQAPSSDVQGDPTRMSQALMNLCLNSVDAIIGRGQITICTAEVSLGEEARALDPELPPGRYVSLKVVDDGEGMEPSVRRRALEPFFSTKGPGKGSGLGLSMVYGTAKSHGGTLLLDSAPQQGTTVTLLLPACDAGGEAAVTTPARLTPARERPRRVLVIDDEALMLYTAQRLLSSLDMEVKTAASGAEGLEVVAAQREPFDLVILDLMMPQMDGVETFERLRALYPEVAVLFATGHGDPDDVAALKVMGARGLIGKPFSRDELAAALDEVWSGT